MSSKEKGSMEANEGQNKNPQSFRVAKCLILIDAILSTIGFLISTLTVTGIYPFVSHEFKKEMNKEPKSKESEALISISVVLMLLRLLWIIFDLFVYGDVKGGKRGKPTLWLGISAICWPIFLILLILDAVLLESYNNTSVDFGFDILSLVFWLTTIVVVKVMLNKMALMSN